MEWRSLSDAEMIHNNTIRPQGSTGAPCHCSVSSAWPSETNQKNTAHKAVARLETQPGLERGLALVLIADDLAGFAHV
ncbi:MAG: hypothetical protein DHS20C16_23650 [Phycisphaerae bacterium]|nr:MAG: hypothetical protein DHS20C16_23650 [Phycisphaerae bacterium]